MTNMMLAIALWIVLAAGQALTQSLPEEFLKITVSNLKCDQRLAEPRDRQFRVYIENTSQNQRISANVRTNTVPGGQRFTLLDSQFGTYTEIFPRFYEHRIAPRERRQIGCSSILRVASNDTDIIAVPVEHLVAGAVFVDPSEPVPPAEDALQFLAFDIRKLPDNRSCLSSNPGIYYGINLHPNRSISSEIDVIDDRGRNVGFLRPVLTPNEVVAMSCTRADSVNFTIRRVRRANFTTLR